MATRRKNPSAMTYDQVEARKERGVEGLKRLGNDDAADALDEESVENFAERKKIAIVNPRRKKHSAVSTQQSARKTKRNSGKRRELKLVKRKKNSRRRRNSGVEDAQQMFEKFHGRKPTSVQEVKIRQEARRNLTGLGKLMYLQTAEGVPMKWAENDKVMVACDPAGNQIYFVGGNQDLSGILKQAGIESTKDLIDVGECQFIIYTADKDFDNFEEKDYQHEFGEESGERPRLMFDRLNQQMYLVGGAYEVKREGIVN